MNLVLPNLKMSRNKCLHNLYTFRLFVSTYRCFSKVIFKILHLENIFKALHLFRALAAKLRIKRLLDRQ
jgi:hypothetical protein